MCKIIFYCDDGDIIDVESQGELRKMLPAGATIIGDAGKERDANCLCPVDVPATLAMHGIAFEEDSILGYQLLNFERAVRT